MFPLNYKRTYTEPTQFTHPIVFVPRPVNYFGDGITMPVSGALYMSYMFSGVAGVRLLVQF